jgi:hypothetical protein
MDNSDDSPTRLTALSTLLILALIQELSMLSFQVARIVMTSHIVVFLLVVCLLLSLTLLWRLCWLHLQPSYFKAGAVRTTVQRLLKPRTPLDCPFCRLACTPSLSVKPACALVRPWSEVKSRRGAPKRIDTQGFACPNQQCAYFGITDAQIHALVGDGKQGHAERIQTFRGPACRSTFTARRHTPLYRLKTPSHQIAVARISRWPKGWTHRPPSGFSVTGKRPSRAFLTRAGEHAQTLHVHCFRNLQLPHLQLDELRTRLRNAKQVLWLWLAIDPCTKIVPVLHLGLRTQNMAHTVIHSLREILAAFLHSAVHQRWVKCLFLCSHCPFRTLAPGGSPRAQSPPVASGRGADLRPGEEKLTFGASWYESRRLCVLEPRTLSKSSYRDEAILDDSIPLSSSG